MALLDMEGCTKYRTDSSANRVQDIRARWYYPGSLIDVDGAHPLSGDTIYDDGSSSQMRMLVGNGEPTTLICGGRFRTRLNNITDTDAIFAFGSKDSTQFVITVGKHGFISCERSIISLEATSYNFAIEPQRWYFIECKIVLSHTVGSYDIKVDGVTIISDTNVDTIDGSGADICRTVRFGLDPSDDYEWADMYLCDTTGASLNDFIGDVHIETVLPDGDGNRTDWTPDSGLTNYTQVDEGETDRDTSYVESSTAGDDDLYTFAALTVDADTVLGCTVWVVGQSLDAGRRILNTRCRSSVSESTGIDMTLHSDRYRWVSGFFEQNPNGPAAWTVAAVNAAEFGVTLTT